MNEEKKKIEQIKIYWDTWITEWFEKCVLAKPSSGEQIQNWNIPISTLGNKENAYKYFPEPYWGNIDTPSLKGVFLNINPGGGNDLQIYDSDDLRNTNESHIHELKEKFASQSNYKYSEFVGQLSNNNEYVTTKWMFNKRIKWLNEMDGLKKGEDEFRTKIKDYLFFDLVPWHTPQKTDISDYCLTHAHLIYTHVLEPISHLSETVEGDLRKKIIVRGSTILDLFNKNEFKDYIDETSISKWIILDSNKPLEKFSSLLTIFKLKVSDSKFYVFSGGASMFLPNPEYTAIAVGGIESTTVKDILQKQPAANSV